MSLFLWERENYDWLPVARNGNITRAYQIYYLLRVKTLRGEDGYLALKWHTVNSSIQQGRGKKSSLPYRPTDSTTKFLFWIDWIDWNYSVEIMNWLFEIHDLN